MRKWKILEDMVFYVSDANDLIDILSNFFLMCYCYFWYLINIFISFFSRAVHQSQGYLSNKWDITCQLNNTVHREGMFRKRWERLPYWESPYNTVGFASTKNNFLSNFQVVKSRVLLFSFLLSGFYHFLMHLIWNFRKWPKKYFFYLIEMYCRYSNSWINTLHERLPNQVARNMFKV